MPIFTGRLPRIYCYSRVWIAKKWESGRKLADRNFSKNRDGARRRWRCSICSRRSPRITGISCKEVLFHPSTISRTVPGYVPRIKINSRVYVCVCVSPRSATTDTSVPRIIPDISREISSSPNTLDILKNRESSRNEAASRGIETTDFATDIFIFSLNSPAISSPLEGGGKK